MSDSEHTPLLHSRQRFGRFKQADLTRALKGVIAAGMQVGRIEIDVNGKIVIFPQGTAAAATKPNPWDVELQDSGRTNSWDEVLQPGYAERQRAERLAKATARMRGR